MWQAEIDPHKNSGTSSFLGGVVQAVSLKRERQNKGVKKGLKQPFLQSIQAQTSGELPVPSVGLKFTARPGTMVEMACL
jgi:hypothetical protein